MPVGLARCPSCRVPLRVAVAAACRLALVLAAAATEVLFPLVLEAQVVLASRVVHSISVLDLVLRAASCR